MDNQPQKQKSLQSNIAQTISTNQLILPKVSRDQRSDYLKAISIFGVVCIHAEIPYSDIFRFSVPVFITIWAFYYERGLLNREQHQTWKYASKRFSSLFVTYLFWTSVYLLLLHSSSDWRITPIHTIIGSWFGGSGFPGQYFFLILFQLTWLLPLFRSFVNPHSVWVAFIVGLFVNILATYWLFPHNYIAYAIGYRIFIYWLPYAFLGIALARGYPRRIPSLLPLSFLFLLLIPYDFFNATIFNNKNFLVNLPPSVYLLPSVILGSFTLLVSVAPRFPFSSSAYSILKCIMSEDIL